MLKLLMGKDWKVNRTEILDRIAQDVQEKKPGRILIVPELISHDTERRLCAAAGDTASRFAEVLTFSRMVRRVSEHFGTRPPECMDNAGRVAVMASAAHQLSSRLKAYASVETRPEFLSALVDGVDEFKRCCISAQDLSTASSQTEGSLAQKLEELGLLMEAYDGLCLRGKRDPRDQINWMLEQMETGSFAAEHVFYIDGFPDFTRQHMAVLEHLLQYSPEVTISLNCDGADSASMAFEKAGRTAAELIRIARHRNVDVDIQILNSEGKPLSEALNCVFQGNITSFVGEGCLFAWRAEGIWQECISAAEQIQEMVRSGCRYRDITLVCTEMQTYKSLIEFVFNRMSIPLYQSGTEEILQKNAVTVVLSALDAAVGDQDPNAILRFIRSPFSPLGMDDCDQLENYVILWGIRGNGWFKSWDFHPDGLGGKWDVLSKDRLSHLNACRSLIAEPLERLKNGFRNARTLAQQVEALYIFLENISLEEKLSQMAKQLDALGQNREAQILDQLWEILVNALDQLYDVLGQTHWEPEHFTRLFRLLISQYDVGTIPPVLDAVQFGPVNAMRCHQEKHLVLLGAQEGSLPGYPGSVGVLTDQERTALRKMGVPLTGGAMEGIQAEFAEIYGVLCGAEESIHIFYPGTQPSFIFRRLAAMAGEEKHAQVCLGLATAGQWEAASFLCAMGTRDNAVELGLEEHYSKLNMLKEHELGLVSWEHIQALYGTTLNLSASQVDRQAECRMSYFLKYGLKAQERKEVTVDPAEFGTYVHAVLENTARCVRDMGGFHQVSLEETMELAHRFSEEYAKERFSEIASDRMTYLFRRNIQELDMIVRELWMELRESQFEPRDFEVSFGMGDGLAPISIPNKRMNALLRGLVDRVDTWVNGKNAYYRVVDYKTGKKDFDYCDVFHGVGLQMLLYLFALRNDHGDLLGDNPVPAGVQYFPARAPYLPSDGKLTEEQAQEARQSQWKRKGILLRDEDVIRAMASDDGCARLSCTVKRDGELSGDLADREQMCLLENYVFQVVGNMVEDIASGNVTPNPYTRGTAHDACGFCPYGSICHKAEVEGRRNYKAMKSEQFWEAVGKEMKQYGR